MRYALFLSKSKVIKTNNNPIKRELVEVRARGQSVSDVCFYVEENQIYIPTS